MQALKEEDQESDDGDADAVSGKPAASATQFFAIPSKKKAKPQMGGEPTAGRALPGGASASLAPMIGGPVAMGGGGGGMGQPPMIGGGGMGGMGGGGMIGGPIASGPIASGPMQGNGQMGGGQFAVQGGPAIGGVPEEESRASSFRVFAILLVLFGMFFAAMTTVAIAGFLYVQYKPEPVEAPVEEPSRRPASHDAEDDEVAVEVKDPVIPDKPKPKPKPKIDVAAAPAEPRKPKAAANAPLSVSIKGSEPYTTIVVRCSGTTPPFSQKAPISGGTGTVAGVPTDQDCELQFTGPMTAKFRPVRGGQSLTCSFVSTTASCK